MPETHPGAGARPGDASPYEPLLRLGIPPSPPVPLTQNPGRLNQPVLFPSDEADVDDDVRLPAPAGTMAVPVARPASKVRWYTYVASGLAGAVLVTAIYALVASGSRSGNGSNPDSAPGGVALSDTARLDRRADTLALTISAFNMRASMYDSHRMPCSGLARGLMQVEDAWLGYNLARRNFLAGPDAARDARDRRLYADVRSVEVKFERSSCARP